MSKSMKSASAAKRATALPRYKVMGTTADGIKVLQPKGRPSFDVSKLRKAVKSARLA